MKTVVHVLFLGMPLCDFSRKVPSEWPEGHLWVSIGEHGQATCEKCIEEARGRNRAR